MEYTKKDVERIQRLIDFDIHSVLGFPLEAVYDQLTAFTKSPIFQVFVIEDIHDHLKNVAPWIKSFYERYLVFDPKKHKNPLEVYERLMVRREDIVKELIDPFDVNFNENIDCFDLYFKLRDLFNKLCEWLYPLGVDHGFEGDIDDKGEWVGDNDEETEEGV